MASLTLNCFFALILNFRTDEKAYLFNHFDVTILKVKRSIDFVTAFSDRQLRKTHVPCCFEYNKSTRSWGPILVFIF